MLEWTISDLSNKSEKLIYISEILIKPEKLHIIFSGVVSQFNQGNPLFRYPNKDTCLHINDLQYHLYKELKLLGYNVDTNTFTSEEVSNLTEKMNLVIGKLNKLEAGQEVVFDRFDELILDFRDILGSMPQGKKPFFQRVAGVMVSYAGTKGADVIFDAIKPDIGTLFKSSVQHLIG